MLNALEAEFPARVLWVWGTLVPVSSYFLLPSSLIRFLASLLPIFRTCSKFDNVAGRSLTLPSFFSIANTA
jgi:hypothetical protein